MREKLVSIVYANERVVCLPQFQLMIKFSEMKQDGRRLKNKASREIINMDRKTELKRLL